MKSLLAMFLICCSAGVMAAPEDAQVDVDDLLEYGKATLQFHSNFVTSGPLVPLYQGGRVSQHTLRLTPELALGLGDGWETSWQVPLARSPGTSWQADGVKWGFKYRPGGEVEQGWYWATKFDFLAFSPRLAAETRAVEWKNITGWKGAHALAAVNLSLARSVRGIHDTGVAASMKVAVDVVPGTMLGIEHFDNLGNTRHLRLQDKMTYLVTDIERQGWSVNFGLGFGQGVDADRRVWKGQIAFSL